MTHWTKGPNAEETRRKISEKKSANPTRYWTGKNHTEETRKKISNAKRVKDGIYRIRKTGVVRKYEHRDVMEKSIGRALLPREVVHHWDENKSNNEIENLALFRRKAAHIHLHEYAKRHKIPVSALKFDQNWLYENA